MDEKTEKRAYVRHTNPEAKPDEVMTKNQFEAAMAEPADPPKPVEPPKPVKPKGLRKWKILFQGTGGNVEIGHNFKLNSYPRNVWTEIDENYLSVLRNAVVETEREDPNGVRSAVRISQHSYELGDEIK